MAINIHNHVNMFSRIKKGKRPLYIYVALLFVWQNYEIQTIQWYKTLVWNQDSKFVYYSFTLHHV